MACACPKWGTFQALDYLALASTIRADEATKSLPLVLVSTVERGTRELKARPRDAKGDPE